MQNAKQLFTELKLSEIRVHAVSLPHPLPLPLPVVSHHHCNNQKSSHNISNSFPVSPHPPTGNIALASLLEVEHLLCAVKLGNKGGGVGKMGKQQEGRNSRKASCFTFLVLGSVL